jgi:methylated-DNA-[protein]-cysteine S-methyltransferase
MITIFTTHVESPVGKLYLYGTEKGLAKVAFDDVAGNFFKDSIVERTTPALAQATRELEEYFAGLRENFSVPLDRTFSKDFSLKVHEYISTIPFGKTVSYKNVAEGVGNSRALQAVGSACGSNPIPIIVPCHRVIKTDGTLGGYAGGLERKQILLAIENKN